MMNDEILEKWKEKTKGLFHLVEYTRFWNYITNLQQERDKYKMRCYNALKMIWDNYGVLDKYQIDLMEDILEGKEDE